MKKLIFAMVLSLVLVSGCEKENKPEWRLITSFDSIFNSDFLPDPKFYRLSESCYLLSSHYQYPPPVKVTLNDCLYKIKIEGNNVVVKELSTIRASIKDISFVDENTGYILQIMVN